jgi:hypothetical protein
VSADDDEARMASTVQRMQAAAAAVPAAVASEQASDQAKFAAREFLARWMRETGEVPSAVVTDRVLFAYEMGYLRGHGDGMRGATTMYDELKRKMNDGQ